MAAAMFGALIDVALGCAGSMTGRAARTGLVRTAIIAATASGTPLHAAVARRQAPASATAPATSLAAHSGALVGMLAFVRNALRWRTFVMSASRRHFVAFAGWSALGMTLFSGIIAALFAFGAVPSFGPVFPAARRFFLMGTFPWPRF